MCYTFEQAKKELFSLLPVGFLLLAETILPTSAYSRNKQLPSSSITSWILYHPFGFPIDVYSYRSFEAFFSKSRVGANSIGKQCHGCSVKSLISVAFNIQSKAETKPLCVWHAFQIIQATEN